jgi:hypothetical protein
MVYSAAGGIIKQSRIVFTHKHLSRAKKPRKVPYSLAKATLIWYIGIHMEFVPR